VRTEASPIFWWGPPQTFDLTSTRFYHSSTPFIPPLFNSKSKDLLTGSGEVLLYCIQQWHHHSERGRAEDKFASKASEKIFWLPPYLKLTYVGPFVGAFIFMGSFTCMGPFCFHVALSLPYGPFTPVRPTVGGFGGGPCQIWQNASELINWNQRISTDNYLFRYGLSFQPVAFFLF